MAANVPNAGAFMASIGLLFTDIRDRLQACQDQAGYVTSMGGATFLTTAPPNGIGLSTVDANALIAALGNMSAVAVGYQGGPAAPVLNYKANTEPFWGGQ